MKLMQMRSGKRKTQIFTRLSSCWMPLRVYACVMCVCMCVGMRVYCAMCVYLLWLRVGIFLSRDPFVRLVSSRRKFNPWAKCVPQFYYVCHIARLVDKSKLVDLYSNYTRLLRDFFGLWIKLNKVQTYNLLKLRRKAKKTA